MQLMIEIRARLNFFIFYQLGTYTYMYVIISKVILLILLVPYPVISSTMYNEPVDVNFYDCQFAYI